MCVYVYVSLSLYHIYLYIHIYIYIYIWAKRNPAPPNGLGPQYTPEEAPGAPPAPPVVWNDNPSRIHQYVQKTIFQENNRFSKT